MVNGMWSATYPRGRIPSRSSRIRKSDHRSADHSEVVGRLFALVPERGPATGRETLGLIGSAAAEE